ncbi:hypothetical protein ACF06X_32815 [Streptomyces sp. NPDC015346]|uniref:AbiJ-related protein n=1 Tax=Streptomyces sp. NPDC015346 TaxID=3364954 RepID=UPI003700C3D8
MQQHRNNNEDLDDDWIVEDPRLELSAGPDEVLLAFLARTVHPEVAAGVEEATKRVEELHRLLAPDGWGLRPHKFLSGRPIYTPVRLPPTGPLVPLPLNDDDTSKLDPVLGQTYSLLDCAGEETARDLLRMAVLTLRRDGGFFHPMPGDDWTEETYAAVLTVERELQPHLHPGDEGGDLADTGVAGEHGEDREHIAEPARPPLTAARVGEMTVGLREAMDDVRRSVAVLAARVRDAHAARVWAAARPCLVGVVLRRGVLHLPRAGVPGRWTSPAPQVRPRRYAAGTAVSRTRDTRPAVAAALDYGLSRRALIAVSGRTGGVGELITRRLATLAQRPEGTG